MKENSWRKGVKIGAVAIMLLLLVGGVFAGNIFATPGKVDPHTKVGGTMITIYELKDGYLTIKETFTSAELKQIYGDKEISREEKFKVEGNLTGTKTKKEFKELYVIRADEKEKISILASYPYPQWTYKWYGSYFVRSDPINLAWEDSSELMVKLWLEDEGWTWACGGTQYVYDNGWKAQDDSLEDPGSGCYDTGGRTHIRLWQISNGDVVSGAHNEYWSWTKFNHIVTSFEGGENRVDDDFYDFLWDVDEDSAYLNNYVSSPYNNGWTTVITQLPV